MGRRHLVPVVLVLVLLVPVVLVLLVPMLLVLSI